MATRKGLKAEGDRRAFFLSERCNGRVADKALVRATAARPFFFFSAFRKSVLLSLPMDIFQGAVVISEANVSHFRAHELLEEFLSYVSPDGPQHGIFSLLPPDGSRLSTSTY